MNKSEATYQIMLEWRRRCPQGPLRMPNNIESESLKAWAKENGIK